ncbi:DIMBOA UDP-glucosyltransferase BX9-like [Hordeum vulgare subsp. vulgare]|uniref:Glycosyltransferase n=1 Tax=Hordeum vulgare subsp. vulgare TaxID=112509 RepID=A0A8I6WYM0_HORVV|nr:DIMBOA UDP-glucosyltransferase BX9-like [Hordeum vulgare subsp. vulgare]
MAGVQELEASHSHGDVRRQERARRVLVFPLPFQGHINPMLQLADVLHGRGLAVTVLHTQFNALDPALHPEFTFVAVPDGIPADVAASGSIIPIILAMNAAMEASSAVHDVLASVLADDGQPPAACMFIDANLLAVQKAASALGLPTMVLRTGSAACFSCFLAYPMLHHNGYLPPKESQLYTPVKELPPLRVRDLFVTSSSDHEMVRKVLSRASETVRNSSGLVVNTFDALEAAELDRIRRELDVPVVLAAGPLHKLSSRSTGSSLLREDRSCMEWLDKQAVGSVLYVSFGSLASMDGAELCEVAWGLADSGQPFLWVVRRDLVRGSDGPGLPEGFDRAVEGRGKVIPWAPQQEVLAHFAVGGFWTHNGWNSTLEGVGEGLPMICMPHFADQMMNTRYVEAVWGVGFELEGKKERNKIAKAIQKLMNEREGELAREKARELKKKVAACLESGGSSMLAIDKLVEHISSL